MYNKLNYGSSFRNIGKSQTRNFLGNFLQDNIFNLKINIESGTVIMMIPVILIYSVFYNHFLAFYMKNINKSLFVSGKSS